MAATAQTRTSAPAADCRGNIALLSARFGSQPMDRRNLGDAGDVHGGAGHSHCLGRVAVYRRVAGRVELRSDVGVDKLLDRQRRNSPCEQLVRSSFRTQALPDVLRRSLHRCQLLLWCSADAGTAVGRAHPAGRGRRSAAAALAGDSAGELPSGQTWSGDGALRIRRSRRARIGANARRMADRHV